MKCAWSPVRGSLLGASACLLASCLDPLVGAECAARLSPCDLVCVDLSTSSAHCGACDQPCAGQCRLGVCDLSGGRDGGDGGSDGSMSMITDGPASSHDGATDLGGAEDSGGDDGGDGAARDVGDAQAMTCDLDAGLSPCPTGCVDLMSDPDHCGRCGNDCASGLCMAGLCQGEGAGHLIVIGHDYTVGRTGINRLVGNAVFLSTANPIRLLSYEGAASAASIAGTNRAIAQVAEAGRPFVRDVTVADALPGALDSHDVLVIHAQGGASDGELMTLGQSWATALRAFLERGKIVVLLDGGNDNTGTHQILTAAGLVTVQARAVATAEIATVALPGDTVAMRVPRNYFAEQNSVRYDTQEMSIVVRASNQAVVLHKVF